MAQPLEIETRRRRRRERRRKRRKEKVCLVRKEMKTKSTVYRAPIKYRTTDTFSSCWFDWIFSSRYTFLSSDTADYMRMSVFECAVLCSVHMCVYQKPVFIKRGTRPSNTHISRCVIRNIVVYILICIRYNCKALL